MRVHNTELHTRLGLVLCRYECQKSRRAVIQFNVFLVQHLKHGWLYVCSLFAKTFKRMWSVDIERKQFTVNESTQCKRTTVNGNNKSTFQAVHVVPIPSTVLGSGMMNFQGLNVLNLIYTRNGNAGNCNRNNRERELK